MNDGIGVLNALKGSERPRKSNRTDHFEKRDIYRALRRWRTWIPA